CPPTHPNRHSFPTRRSSDLVIEMNPYPLAVIDKTVKDNRRIGLGIMGWADVLFLLGVPYDSKEATDLADRLMSFVKEKSHDQSRSEEHTSELQSLAYLVCRL